MKTSMIFLLVIAALTGSSLAAPLVLTFSAYDGQPVQPQSMTFQLNIANRAVGSEFLTLGQMIPNTRLKLTKFEFKEVPVPGGDPKNVSELTVTNIETGETAVLVIGQKKSVP